MTQQIAVKLPEDMIAALDNLVASGRFESRSGAVRAGLRLVIRDAGRELIDLAFAEGFRRYPETEEEMADARRLAIESIDDEPWEPWW